MGRTGSLGERPGHLAYLGESQQGLSVLVLAVLFLWDLWLFPAGTRRVAYVSHDEFGLVHFASSAEQQAFARRLGLLEA